MGLNHRDHHPVGISRREVNRSFVGLDLDIGCTGPVETDLRGAAGEEIIIEQGIGRYRHGGRIGNMAVGDKKGTLDCFDL